MKIANGAAPKQNAHMNPQETADRLEILELSGNWTDAVNWRDFERFGHTWTDDAVWTISDPIPMRVNGREAIIEKLRSLLELEQFFFQALHLGTIRLDGNTAYARFGVTEFGKPDKPGEGYFNHAIYQDELIKTAHGWRFARRDYLYVYVDASLLKGNWYSLDDHARTA